MLKGTNDVLTMTHVGHFFVGGALRWSCTEQADQQSRWRHFANETRKQILWECAEKRQDGSSNPYRLHSLLWSNDHDLRREWSQRRRLPRRTLTGHLEHGRAT